MQQYNSLKSIIFFLLAALFLLYEMAVQSLPAVMTSHIMHDLHISSAQFGVIMGCYFMSYTFMQLPVGLLFDRFSARKIITYALIMCIVGTGLFAISNAGWYMALARLLAGLGSAFAFVGVLVVADQWFSAKYFALLVGIAQLLAAIGAMLGQVPLAYCVAQYGWRSTALYVTAVGLIIFVLILFFMRDRVEKAQETKETKETKETNKNIQTNTGMKVAKTAYVADTKQDSSGHDTLGLAQVITSLKAILGNSQTWYVAIYACTSWAPITFFAELWGVPYLISRVHITDVMAAKYMAIIWISLALMSPLNGMISAIIKRRRIILQMSSLIGLATVFILLYVNATVVLIVVAMIGIGMAASGQIISFAIIKDINKKTHLATAIAFNNMAVVIGGFIFQPVIGYLLHWTHAVSTKSGAVVYAVNHFSLVLIVIPLLYLIGWLVSQFLIKETYCKSLHYEK